MMQPSLFAPSKPFYPYGPDFEEAWRLYKAPKAASKKDAHKAYNQVSAYRPRHEILLLCINEYLSDLGKTKQHKAHLASWLRRHGWEGYLDDATYRFEHPAPKVKPRPAFKASDYEIPPELRATKSAAQILEEHAKRSA